MNKETAFCEECRADVGYVVETVPMTGNLKGVEYRYVGREAHCPLCHSLIYVPEINDLNLLALYDAFRRENGIISLDKVRAIPKKYSIGKRPLSLLLGWGEQTFSRFCEGDVPSKQYSEILSRLYENPRYYSDLLEVGRKNLKSQAAYRKSRNAVDSLLGVSGSSRSEINVAAKYLLSRCEDITPLSLQKALYYSQGFFYAFYGRFLFKEDCEAWVHGPVYQEVYHRYADYRFDPIGKVASFDASILTASEQAVFDAVIDSFCCYSGKVLERFTHSEMPWIESRGDLPSSSPSENIIPRESIGSYFAKVKAKYGMVKPGDIQSYAEDMFKNL